jgi:DNA primase
MQISDIKARLSILTLLAHYGLQADKNHRLCCPFHEDTTPSMQLYPRTNTFCCFSAECQAGSGDVIEFIERWEKQGKHQAILKAKSLLESSLPGQPPPTEPSPNEPPTALSKSAVLSKAFTSFLHAFRASEKARAYARKRSLPPQLEVGYNSGTLTLHSKALSASFENCGLLYKSRFGNGFSVFAKNSLVFALRAADGHIAGLYFRSLEEKGESKHFYLKDRSGLYPAYPRADTRTLILTESVIDAASWLAEDWMQQETQCQDESRDGKCECPVSEPLSVLAAYGTQGLGKEHQKAIAALSYLEEVIFAFDNDEAGQEATRRYSLWLSEFLPAVRLSRLVLPAKDLNETAQTQGNIAGKLLAERTPVFSSTETALPETALPEMTLPDTSQAETPETPDTPQADTPQADTSEPQLDTSDPQRLLYRTPGADYTVLGGLGAGYESLKVSLLISCQSFRCRHKLDLYEDKQSEKLARELSEKLPLSPVRLQDDLQTLTSLLEDYRHRQRQPPAALSFARLGAAERSEAEAFGKEARLMERLNTLLGKTGIVGEEKNRVFLLVIAASYKMPETLHALIQGSSGSGKTRLLKQISDCIPPQSVTRLTRISDKVLYNYSENYFVNRLLCLEDMDGLSEEAQFAFRELQSNGELNSAASVKLENGQMSAEQKTVRGPIASLCCTTRGEIYEDNMGRCFLLAVDESPEQTRKIIAYQNARAAGEIETGKEGAVKKFLQNFIGGLAPWEVVNPYAHAIQLPPKAHKIRRLNELFQRFVKMLTLLHQYQRQADSRGRLLSEREDIETAISIMFEGIVLKVDELEGGLRQFYEQLKSYLHKQYPSPERTEFSLLEIRQALKVSKTQLFRYIQELTGLEYIVPCGGFANRGYRYRIAHWDDYQGMREDIKQHLRQQLEAIPPTSGREHRTGKEHPGTPLEHQNKV